MFLLSVLMMGSLALAENRIFNSLGDKECQSCLGGVESKCRGPTSSDQFNDCFCSIGEQGLAWPKLTDCLTGSNAQCAEEDQYQILSYWGAHCFAYKDDEEEQVCIDSTQDDKLLMSVADSFCTEFLTLTSATSSSTSTEVTTTTTVSKSEETSDAEDPTTTTSETAASASTTEASETSTTSRPTAGEGSGSGADTGSGRDSSNSQDGEDNNDDADDEDDGVAALLPTSSGTVIAALCFSFFLAQLL